MKKQITAALLFAYLISCSCNASNNTSFADDTSGENELPATSSAAEPLVEVRDFNEKEFLFYVRYNTDGWDWNVDDLMSDEETGEPVNDAVYKRNLTIQERYNCSISQIKSNDMSGSSAVRSAALAGDGTYDAVILSGHDMVALGHEELLHNLLQFDEMDTTKSYWNPTLIRELTLGGKLYYAMGDLSATDNRAVRCLYFNKDLFDKYKLDNPYELVKAGDWTFEKYFSMVADGRIDLDGNGVYDLSDQWGLFAQPTIGITMFYAGGGQFLEKNENDLLEVVFGNSVTIDLMSKISESIKSTSDEMFLSNEYQTMIPAFADGKSLFYAEVSLFIERFRQYEFDVGMLPIPKTDENQENYCQYADGFCLNLAGIPIDSKTPNDTALLLEALSAESPETLTEAYYDICLTGKAIRDNESAEMLDIIFNNYTIDYADLLKLSCISQLTEALSGEREIASTVASAIESAQASIDEINKTGE